MATVKRIAPGSAFKVGLVVIRVPWLNRRDLQWHYFPWWLESLGSLAGGGVPGARALGFGFGLSAIIVFRFCTASFGGIGGVIAAAV